MPTKLIAISLDDATYNRLEQVALAKGLSITEYARTQLGVETIQKETNDEYEKRVHDATVSKMKKDAEHERGRLFYYDVKVYKTTGRRIRVYWRTRPMTAYDAMMSGHPGEEGKWELRIQKEAENRSGNVNPRDYVGGDWYKESSESKFYWKRRGLHKAINSLLAHYGRPNLYNEGPKTGPEPDEPEGVGEAEDEAP